MLTSNENSPILSQCSMSWLFFLSLLFCFVLFCYIVANLIDWAWYLKAVIVAFLYYELCLSLFNTLKATYISFCRIYSLSTFLLVFHLLIENVFHTIGKLAFCNLSTVLCFFSSDFAYGVFHHTFFFFFLLIFLSSTLLVLCGV